MSSLGSGRRSVLVGFLGLNVLAGLSVGVAKVVLSLYAVELGADAVQLGLIAGVQSAGILLMSLPAGVLVDQYGPLRLFSIGTLISGMLYLAMPVVDSAMVLVLLVLLISCFMPLRIVSLSAMLMQQINRVGIGMAGWFRATHMVGMFLFGPLMAAGLLQGFGFVGSYVVIAGIFFLLVLLAPWILSHYQRVSEHARRLSLAELKAQIALLNTDRLLRSSCLREFCIQAVNQFYTFFIVAIAIQGFQFSTSNAAVLISVQGSAYILAMLGMGRLAWRMDERLFFRCGCVLIVTALAVLGGATVSWVLWLGAALLGLGLGMLQIVNISCFAQVGACRGQGRVAGLTTFVGPAGGLIGCTLGGVFGHYFGLQATFFVLAMIFVVFILNSLLQQPADLDGIE